MDLQRFLGTFRGGFALFWVLWRVFGALFRVFLEGFGGVWARFWCGLGGLLRAFLVFQGVF